MHPGPRSAAAHLHRFLERSEASADADFSVQLASAFDALSHHFYSLYGGRPDVGDALDRLLDRLHAAWQDREAALRAIDRTRQSQGAWWRAGCHTAMQLYVDRTAGTIDGVRTQIPYYQELGASALHLMPFLASPADASDGGYAVSNYGEVQPHLGTISDLRDLAREMHEHGMVLMVDYVLNHTSDRHAWAVSAREGNPRYQRYYHMYPDRTIPDAFEELLPEVFPETAPGNFTWVPSIERWVMTVFHDYQWDLDYSNPDVLIEMVGIMLDLANLGVDILRLDAVPYLWKQVGTQSRNLPGAHSLVRLLNACARVAAPGLALLAEAIVEPHEIVRYFGEGYWAGRECEFAYNAQLMVLLWDALATGRSGLLRAAIERLPQPPADGSWLNYVRCHDDIGLGYNEDDLRSRGWDAHAHRQFVISYYTGEFAGSSARGARFMYNPKTGDARISGTAASLAGIEAALAVGDDDGLARSVDRVLLLHAIVLALPGLPVIYAGDELGLCNDYTFATDPTTARDNRWMHRPHISDQQRAERTREGTVAHAVFTRLRGLIRLRSELAPLSVGGDPVMHRVDDDHLLAFSRATDGGSALLAVFNLSASPRVCDHQMAEAAGLRGSAVNAVTGESFRVDDGGSMVVGPWRFVWLVDGQATGPNPV